MGDEIDYAFAPRSYWDAEWITELATTRGSYERWVKQGLDPDARPVFGGSPASLEAGEYLPDMRPGEVEIARVELDSTLGDVVSVRATRRPNGRIYFRIVNEYDTKFEINPKSSTSPLSLIQLISLIDNARWEGEGEEVGLTDSYRNGNLEGCEPHELVNFVTISSDYYPALNQHYERQAIEWLYDILVERWDDDYGCECGQDIRADDLRPHAAECLRARPLPLADVLRMPGLDPSVATATSSPAPARSG